MSVTGWAMRAVPVYLSILLVGCAPSGTLVGNVSGADTVVGIALGDDGGRMYVCGGPEDQDIHHHWVTLERDGDRYTGTADELSVTFQGDRSGVSGEITTGEETFAFTAEPGSNGDGPWRDQGDLNGCQSGVVVRDGGSAMQGVLFCPAEPSFAQVVPIGVFNPEEGEVRVGVDGDPNIEFTVLPVDPG